MQPQQLDSVLVKEKASQKYVHFDPESGSYYTREGSFGACVFKPDIVHQFIVQVLGHPELYATEAFIEPVNVQRKSEQAAYASIRERGYRG